MAKITIIKPNDTEVIVNTVSEGTIPLGSTLNVTTNVTPDSVSLVGDVLDINYNDTTYNIFVNGVLDQSFTTPALEDLTINITA